ILVLSQQTGLTPDPYTTLFRSKHGGITKAKQTIKHNGSSLNKQRQESAHVHMVYFSPDKKYVFANDLGTDKIYVYKYDKDTDDEDRKSTHLNSSHVKLSYAVF